MQNIYKYPLEKYTEKTRVFKHITAVKIIIYIERDRQTSLSQSPNWTSIWSSLTHLTMAKKEQNMVPCWIQLIRHTGI